MKINISNWDESFDDKYDVTDYFSEGHTAEDFKKLLDEATEFKSSTVGFETMTINQLLKAGFKNPPPVVRELLLKNGIGTIAGTDGVGKSLYASQFAIHCALGIDFLGYEVRRPWKVLLINFELTNGQMSERLDNMKLYITDTYRPDPSLWNNLRFNLMNEKIEVFRDLWDRIESTIQDNPGCEILIIDNLYTSTDKNVSENYDAQQLWGRIHKIRLKYDISILLVNHHTKNLVGYKTLNKEMIRGGKSFTDFCSTVAQMAASTINQDYRVFKITKCRDKSETQYIPQLLVWNGIVFENRGAIENEEIHYIDPKTRAEFEALRSFEGQESFTTNDWIEYCTEILDPPVAERTAKGWLKKLKTWGRIKKVHHGEYEVVPLEIE